MVKPLEHKKRQQTLLGLLAIVLIITAFVWYSGYKKKPYVEELVPAEEEARALIDEERLKEIKLDFSILDDALFKSLKSHGVLPVTSGETGRKNPFEPY